MGEPAGSPWFGLPDTHDRDGPTSPTGRFFDLSIDMLCLAGVDGYFKVLNQAWSDTLGYKDGELLQKPFVDFVHPDDRQATIAAAATVANGGKLVHFRNRYRCKDGTYKWLSWTAAPALDDGTIYAAARDVTDGLAAEAADQKQCEQRRKRVLAVMAEGGVRAVFQPIVNLSSLEVGGYEALSRFVGPFEGTPDQWFGAAEAAGLGSQLQIHAIHQALSHAYRLPAAAYLSVNASPETLVSKEFRRLISGLHGASLVVEVTEHSVVEDYEPLQRAIDALRRDGVRLAIDDAGAGFASSSTSCGYCPSSSSWTSS